MASSNFVDISELFLTINDLARTRDWLDCLETSEQILGLGKATMATALSHGARTRLARDRFAGQHTAMDFFLNILDEHEDARAIFVAEVGEVDTITPDEITETLRGRIETATDGIGSDPWARIQSDWAILAGVKGTLGCLHARLNLDAQTMQDASTSPADTDAAIEVIRTFAAELEDRLLSLYSAAVQGAADSAVEKAQLLGTMVEINLPVLARQLATLHVGIETLLSQGQNGEAEKLGRDAISASETVRDAIAAHASAAKLGFELSTGDTEAEVSELMEGAARKAFQFDLPNGKDTDIANVGSVEADRLIDVRGFVTQSRAERQSDGKLVSRLTLLDPSSNATTSAAAIFVNLVYLGVGPGTFSQVSGHFTSSSVIMDAGPGIEIARLPLSEIKEQSWRVSFLVLSDPWYRRWVNGTNIQWALTPHTNPDTEDGGEAPRFFVGANELIYLPFFRG